VSLRIQAEADLTGIIQNEDDFGWPCVLTEPSGFSAPLTVLSSDIAQVIDPDTGIVVSGRFASVAIQISSLTTAGFSGLPEGISNSALKPWVVVFDDIGGVSHTFKVKSSNPDRALGIVVCKVELYSA
jgi:hypothetical protein